MLDHSFLDVDSQDYRFYVDDRIVVLTFGQNVFDNLISLEISSKLLQLLDAINDSPNIAALLIFNERESLGDEAYERFIDQCIDVNAEVTYREIPSSYEKKKIRAREIFRLQNFVSKMISMKKIVFNALYGTVVTPFFGAALAADYRFAHKDMRFSLSHLKYDLHPSGGLAYFLPRLLNRNKAFDILMHGGYISAAEAFELGLVNEIFEGSFEEYKVQALESARKMCHSEKEILQTKKLLNFREKEDLERYFEIEAQFVDHS